MTDPDQEIQFLKVTCEHYTFPKIKNINVYKIKSFIITSRCVLLFLRLSVTFEGRSKDRI